LRKIIALLLAKNIKVGNKKMIKENSTFKNYTAKVKSNTVLNAKPHHSNTKAATS